MRKCERCGRKLRPNEDTICAKCEVIDEDLPR